MSEKAILFDATKCIGCRACEVACRHWNELKAVLTNGQGTDEDITGLSPNTWLTVKCREERENGTVRQFFSRRSCMHCTEAVCIEICPAGALFRNQYGFVSYDKDRCIGCGYCVEFCPFTIPRLDTGRLSGVGNMDKCTLCTTQGRDRLSMGKEPACVEICPTDAIIYDDRDRLVAEGRRRVAALKSFQSKTYPKAMLYGETELGGLHVLYVLADSPNLYGLPKEPKFPALATVQREIFRPFSWIVWTGVALLLATNVLVTRARQLRKKEED
ncbi:4Fe-4S dicluster domain-containing protein [Chloroflexota bacterium]